jgi:hypothetical protein
MESGSVKTCIRRLHSRQPSAVFDTGVLNFHEGPNPIDTALQVGDYRVRQISWPAAESVAPDAAAHTFVASIAKWLEPLGDHLEAFVPSATGAHS